MNHLNADYLFDEEVEGFQFRMDALMEADADYADYMAYEEAYIAECHAIVARNPEYSFEDVYIGRI